MSTGDDGASRLKLSDLNGAVVNGNAVLGVPSIEDKIAERELLADYEKRIRQLERHNANLKQALEKAKKQETRPKAGGQGKARHIAHAEGWQAVCTAPDFCKVGKDVVAFNSFATLDQKHTASPNVKARGTQVYRKGDVVKNVQADAGQHIVSGTSLGSGHVKILDGHENVKVNGIPVARHDSRCLINCDASGVGGAQGKLVTEQKTVGGNTSPAASEAPLGKRTSAKLEALKKAREAVAAALTDFNAIDEYVNFQQSNEVLDGLIAQISGSSGSAAGYAAQAARGLLGFTKDLVMGVGELAYEGIKAVPKLARLTQTESGKLNAQLDAQILAENIHLSNITPGSVGRDALNIGKAIIKPVTDPWAKGQYVESLTRGAAEVGTLGLGWLKGSKAARAAKAADAATAADATKSAALINAVDAVVPAKTGGAVARGVDDGVHVASPAAILATRRRLAENFYLKSGTPQSKIDGHLAGIDFTKSVDVVTVEKGALLNQYQVPGAPQGSYYSPLSNGSSPSSLGISGQSTDRVTGTIIDKLPKPYEVTDPVEMLRSSAAPILDTWSIPGTASQTEGGSIQLFSSSKNSFTPKVR
jgi:uncharacterized Zn-binding protein involved in type VI secretion